MLNNYIKNIGTTRTFVFNKNNSNFNEINWNSLYDGNNANIEINTNVNGNKEHYNIYLDNNDLEKILTVPSIDRPIHERIYNDFNDKVLTENDIYKIELPSKYENVLTEKDIQYPNKNTHISSPLINEEFFAPISIRKNNKPSKKHKKTHITHKIYKKNKKRKNNSNKISFF